MSKIASQIASRIASLTPEGAAPAAPETSTTPAAPVLPPAGDGGGSPEAARVAEASQEAAQGAPAAPQEDPAAKARAELLEARLKEQRERRAAARELEEAKKARTQAEQEAAAAKTERAKWEALRQGNFKEGIEALGLNPRTVFEEMQREAIEASTPEAELKRMRADFERQLGEKLKPLEETIAELQKQRDRLAADAQDRQLRAVFTGALEEPTFQPLRVAYDDDVILGFVKDFQKNPDSFYELADQYQIPLTDPEQGFTMHEALLVLAKVQDEYERGRQHRAQRFAPKAPAAPSAPATPTVNGTAERRNAGTTITPDLEGERAAPPRKLSRRERIDREVEKARRS